MDDSATPSGTPDADVLIVGAGPVGLYLALRLGSAGHRIIVVEKQPTHYPLPRAVTFDDEIARLFAEIGIDSDNDPIIEQTDDRVLLRNGDRDTIGVLDWRGVTSAGWHRLNWFHQPTLEKRLAAMVGELGTVTVLRSWELADVYQDNAGVTISGRVAKSAGKHNAATLRGRYLVGADGANSRVREQAELEVTDLGFYFDWLICDVIPHDPAALDSTVYQPPMWQLCDPNRPTTIVPGGPSRRRWEFMALPGENLNALDTDEKAWELLAPWGVNPDSATLERHTVWRFHAKYATRWSDYRVLIAGDAAHLMPPFAGQGMCAGIRDAAGLAWRLNHLLRGVAGPKLLESYGPERSYHVSHFIELSMELGRAVCVTDPEEAAARDAIMKAALNDPTPARPAPPPLALGPGVWRHGDPQAGRLSHQGIVTVSDRTGRFDQVFGTGWALLGRQHDPLESLSGPVRRAFLSLGGRGAALGDEIGGVHDMKGEYATWFDELGVDTVLVRPDFYVAASCPRAGTDLAVRDVLARAGVPVDGG